MGRVGFAACALALGLVAGACSDDDGSEAKVATQEEYDAEAQRLCNQHGSVIDRAFVEVREDSDAEEVAFYTSDFIPRARALIRGLAAIGLPADKDAEYRDALNRALAVLQELEDDPYEYIDHRHARDLPPDEDLLNRLRVAFDDADVPC